MTVYGYIRVSTGKQADEGHSLPAQNKKILAYATLKDLPRPILFCDAATSAAKHPLHNRPQGAQLLHHLRSGDHVIVTKLDRAFRSTRDALENIEAWREKGVTFHVTDLGVDLSTPMGRFFFTVIAAVAELEGAQISERTKIGLEQARSVGIRTSRAPHGFTHDDQGHLDPKLPDLIVVASLLRMRQAQWPMTRRLGELDRRGWTTSTGKPWDEKRLKDANEIAWKNRELIEEALRTLDIRVVCDELALLVRMPEGTPGADVQIEQMPR